MSSLFLSVCWYSYTLDVTTLDHLKNSLIDWIILLPLISSDSVYQCVEETSHCSKFLSVVFDQEKQASIQSILKNFRTALKSWYLPMYIILLEKGVSPGQPQIKLQISAPCLMSAGITGILSHPASNFLVLELPNPTKLNICIS